MPDQLRGNAVNLCQCARYVGAHTHDQADDAIPNGRMIIKIMADDGDTHIVGTHGVVIGSIEADQETVAKFGYRFWYFIEWRPSPGIAVGVVSGKIGLSL